MAGWKYSVTRSRSFRSRGLITGNYKAAEQQRQTTTCQFCLIFLFSLHFQLERSDSQPVVLDYRDIESWQFTASCNFLQTVHLGSFRYTTSLTARQRRRQLTVKTRSDESRDAYDDETYFLYYSLLLRRSRAFELEDIHLLPRLLLSPVHYTKTIASHVAFTLRDLGDTILSSAPESLSKAISL